MTTSIVKFSKQDFLTHTSMDLFIEDASELTIVQYADATISTSHTLPFEIPVADTHAPSIDEAEMALVIREKVDLSARGPNDVPVKNAGKDLGGENYIDKKPYRPKTLPPGFQEVLKL